MSNRHLLVVLAYTIFSARSPDAKKAKFNGTLTIRVLQYIIKLCLDTYIHAHIMHLTHNVLCVCVCVCVCINSIGSITNVLSLFYY